MNPNITFLRALAIILVVFGHSIIIYDPSWGIYTPSVQSDVLRQIKSMINIVQMPLFMSLSGYLFYYTQQKKTCFLNFARKKHPVY